MYAVVSNVEQYYQFVPWCQRSSIVNRHSDMKMDAEMEIGFQIFVERCAIAMAMHLPCKFT